MQRVAVNGVELNYDIAGPDGAPLVAFSNCLGGTLEVWDKVAAALAGRFRVLRYDTRAHGRSASADVPIAIDDLAADLAGLIDTVAEGEPAHLVGLSLGGMTVQALATAEPARALSVALVDTGPYLPPAEAWRTRAATVRAGGMATVADQIVARWFTPAFYAAAAAEVAAVRQRFLACEPTGYARCCEAVAAMDLRERVRAIAAPTLVAVGAEDQVTPVAMAEDLRDRIAGAKLAVIPAAAHLAPVEQPAALVRHLTALFARSGRR